jgi:ABC-type transport system substrate-binding protein
VKSGGKIWSLFILSVLLPSAYAPGTGPFRFAEYKPGQQLVLRAFRDYWVKGIPYLDEVVLRPIQESNVRITSEGVYPWWH